MGSIFSAIAITAVGIVAALAAIGVTIYAIVAIVLATVTAIIELVLQLIYAGIKIFFKLFCKLFCLHTSSTGSNGHSSAESRKVSVRLQGKQVLSAIVEDLDDETTRRTEETTNAVTEEAYTKRFGENALLESEETILEKTEITEKTRK
ncbi:hypothetical protein NEOLEDRAFT_1144794 [Neolentinus lepideus HHB14362 ss-1]|uniref:Uncharacterized protein n=1 Tax=Neolentinus lepideus HHB14362 ss-1 TaxID=1314782 RepID=A0A165VHF7_9AGAM|nr:hypothetical protein NEOLEDRAFT_1144794 [Neolentinus lepideus HHB14362 ss-1]